MQYAGSILSSVASPPLQYFSTLSHNRYGFREGGGVKEHEMCVFIFSTILSETFLILRRNERDTWCGRKVMRLIFFLLWILFFLKIKVIPFKIVLLVSYTATEALFPLFVAVREGFCWYTFQLVGYALLDSIQRTKMSSFQVVFETG